MKRSTAESLRRACVAGGGGVLLAASIFFGAAEAEGQSRPFVFTVTTSPPSAVDDWTVQYDAGYADSTADAVTYDGVEQRLSVQGALGKGFTVRGQFGLGVGGDNGTRSSQEAELLKDVLSGSQGLGLSVGVGVRREWEGTTTLLARVAVGHSFEQSSLFGNLRVEKSFATGRDDVDLIATLGWLHRVGSAFHLGVEAVGQDLEGLWEQDEAEGGARVFVGPSLHLSPPGQRYYASLCGGPVLYASRSSGTSTAPRPLGSGNGYTVRLSVGYAF